jgi:hypothetical protein
MGGPNTLVREHFGPAGRPKRGFDSQQDAWTWRATHNGVKRKTAYQCSVCGKWHLGRSRKR